MIRMRPSLTPLQLLGGGLLLWHVDRAVKHQRACPHCAERDFMAITLDIPHLWAPSQPDQPDQPDEPGQSAGSPTG
jgi:hypothetical protein